MSSSNEEICSASNGMWRMMKNGLVYLGGGRSIIMRRWNCLGRDCMKRTTVSCSLLMVRDLLHVSSFVFLLNGPRQLAPVSNQLVVTVLKFTSWVK